MKKYFIVFLFAFVAYNIFGQSSIFIDFKYKNLSVELKEFPDGKKEKTTKDFGQSVQNLQMRDVLNYLLKENKYDVALEENKANYIILLSIATNNTYQPSPPSWIDTHYSIIIEIYKGKDLIGRKILRGKNNFTEYSEKAANDISKYIFDIIKL